MDSHSHRQTYNIAKSKCSKKNIQKTFRNKRYRFDLYGMDFEARMRNIWHTAYPR